MDIISTPYVKRRAHLMTPQLLPSPLPSKDGACMVHDPVEELAAVPAEPTSRRQITLATEFGHMIGHRMSVAPMSNVAAPLDFGDTLPGSKARRMLGIRTSSGFDDSEFKDDPKTVLCRSRSTSSARSASPSFMHAISSVVRRASSGNAADRSSPTDYGKPIERKASFTQLFSRALLSNEHDGSDRGISSADVHYNKAKPESKKSNAPSLVSAGDRLAICRSSEGRKHLPSMLIRSADDFEAETLDAIFRATSTDTPSSSDQGHRSPSYASTARSSSPSSVWSCRTGSSMSLNDVLLNRNQESQESIELDDMKFVRPRAAPKPPITPFSNLARLEASVGAEESQDEQEITDSECDSDSVQTDNELQDDPLQSIINARTSQELQVALNGGQSGTSKARSAKARPPRLFIIDSATDLCQRRSRAVPVDEQPESAVTPGRIAFNEEQGKKAAMVKSDSDDALDNIILDISSPLDPAKRQASTPRLPPKSPFRRPKRYILPI